MANAGIIDGGDLMLYAEIDTPATFTLIGDAKSHKLSSKSEIRTRRTKQTGDYPGRYYTGLDASVSTDCLVTYGATGYYELLALQLAKTKVKLKLAGHDDADLGVVEAAGDKYLEGTFVIDSIELNASEGDDASYSASFSIDGDTGPLEIKTVAGV